MKISKPLDRYSLARIPLAEGTLTINGPYDLKKLVQEPDWESEFAVELRKINVIESEGVSIGSALIEVTRKSFSKKVTICPHTTGEIRMETRYLFRRDASLPIEGGVTLQVTYLLHGVVEKYAPACRKVIRELYVTPSSRGQGISRILLAEVLTDAPDVMVFPHFSKEGARLFGFDARGKRHLPPTLNV